jgi:hypothetical protein
MLFFTIIFQLSVITVKNTNDDIGWYTDLVLDENDYPHISYYDYMNGDLKYCFWNGNYWEIQVVDSMGDVGRYTSIALDSNNHSHISYYDHSNGDLKYCYWNGDYWNITTIDEIGKVGLFNCIALDNYDYPHISYVDYDNIFLKYAFWNGNEWIIETVDENVGLGEYFSDTTSIAIDDSNNPHISYCNRGNHDLKYAYFDGFSWNKNIVDTKGEVGQYSSLALDSENKPHISYASWSNFDLKYAYLSDETWYTETIDHDGDIRKWTSIDLDSNDMPHISYYDYTEGSLRYTFFTGSDWQIETVENEGSTGCFNSICLTSDDKAVISYYDWGNKALKHASSIEDHWLVTTIEIDSYTDFVDQQQIYCSGYSWPINDGKPVAQSFTPDSSILTMIELMIVKIFEPGDFSVSIREKIDGEDLVKITIQSEEINEDLSWKTFDIPDINITPGQEYYIVCSSSDTGSNNMYYWYFGHNDPYMNGEAWVYDKNKWEVFQYPGFPDIDMGFKTFGFINEIPSNPVIDGPSYGKPNVEYDYNITSYDENNDELFYEIEWNHFDNESIGPYSSGETVTVKHMWLEQGNYTIRVKAIDTHGGQSDWGTLDVSMSKIKAACINNFILRFLQNHPHLFPILQKILGL